MPNPQADEYPAELVKAIDDFHSGSPWDIAESRATYLCVANSMLNHGYSLDDAIELLHELTYAAEAEYRELLRYDNDYD